MVKHVTVSWKCPNPKCKREISQAIFAYTEDMKEFTCEFCGQKVRRDKVKISEK